MPRLPLAASALLPPLCGLFLLGCAATEPAAVIVPPVVLPTALRQCQARPEPPAEPTSDADLARFILALDERGEDCASTLARTVQAVLGAGG